MKPLLLLLSVIAFASSLSSCASPMQAQVNDPQNPMGADQVSKSPNFTPTGPGALL